MNRNSPHAVGVFINFDPLRPAELTVKVFDMDSDKDGHHFVDLDDTDPRFLNARLAIAQAVGLGMRWNAGSVALVAAVGIMGDGRAILGRHLTPLEISGVAITLGNISHNLLNGQISGRAESDPKLGGMPP